VIIRSERAGDVGPIAELITRAFDNAPHASGKEASIVERLRRDGNLAMSLVAIDEVRIVGHIAFSRVLIDAEECEWFGLGPVAVRPEQQRQGIGGALIEYGLAGLRKAGAYGCVVLGEPGYYGRFGFETDAGLTYPGPPAEYFQRIVFHGHAPRGIVEYAPAFG
jgi:putative acetyltransferase